MMYAHSPDGDTAAPWRSVGSLSTCCCCYWSQYITSNFAMYMQRVCNSCGNYSIALEGRFIDVQKRRLCICIYVYINPIINHQADTRQEGDQNDINKMIIVDAVAVVTLTVFAIHGVSHLTKVDEARPGREQNISILTNYIQLHANIATVMG